MRRKFLKPSACPLGLVCDRREDGVCFLRRPCYREMAGLSAVVADAEAAMVARPVVESPKLITASELKAWRIAAGLSTRHVSEATNIRQIAVMEIERGKRQITPELAARLGSLYARWAPRPAL